MLNEFDKLPYKKFLFTTKQKTAHMFDYAYLFPKNDESEHLISNEFRNSDKIIGFKKLKGIINK